MIKYENFSLWKDSVFILHRLVIEQEVSYYFALSTVRCKIILVAQTNKDDKLQVYYNIFNNGILSNSL